MRDSIIMGVGGLGWLGLTVFLVRVLVPAINPRVTAVMIAAIPITLGLLDVALYKFGGNESTISFVMLSARAARPLVALSTVYSFAVLIRHFYFPEFVPAGPPAYEVVARMFVVLSPTIYAIIILANGNGTLAAHQRALEAGGQYPFAGYVLAASVAGFVMGRFLPQHVPPLPT
jgi:hypothetical protein